MKFLKSYKVFESVDEIKSIITDILRDNVLDKDIPLEIFIRNYRDIDYNNPIEVVKIQIGFRDLPDRFFVDEDADFDDFIIRADELKEDILTITNYLKDEGYRYNTYSYEDRGDIKGNMGDVMDSIGLETTYLNLFYKKPIRETYLESFTSINESDDISFVKDLLLDISDGDVSIRVTDLKKYSPNSPIKKISIIIGDDGDGETDFEDKIDILKYIQTLEDVNDYLSPEGYTIDFSHFIYTDEFEEDASFYSIDFDEIKDKLQNIESLRICEIVYKNVEFINDYIKECKWNIQNSLANCAFFAKDFYQWCQKKGIDCKLAYCEQSAPINSQCEPEDHIIPMIGRYLIDFVYTDKGVSHIVRENNKSESLKRQTNPEVTEIGQFREKYGKWGYKNIEVITYEQAFGKDGRCQTIELKETIKVPIEVGDTVLGGRFKNKKIVVKKIGKNKKGDITINDKPLLKFRIVKESLQEDVDYYLRHLEDDNFLIQVSDDYFRIFKPINGTVYSYSNCNLFQWSEIAGEIDRYVSELEGKSIDYCYVLSREGGVINRKYIHPHMLLDETFDCGEILSFTIGFK
jgi:hypothetical protein